MSKAMFEKKRKYLARKNRVKNSISKGTADRPRIVVYRSNTDIYVQAIDDQAQKTLVATDSRTLKGKRIDQSKELGKIFGDLLKKAKIAKGVFDRNGFVYTGRVQVFCDAIRETGFTL